MTGTPHLLAALLAASLLLTGCQPPEAATGETPVWRQFNNADGSQTAIPQQPRRILSTSVTLTGALLAIDAPVVASAAAANGQFFQQWQAVAEARGVQKAWPAGSVDLEAAMAFAPDLILVSTGGGDSALEQLAALQRIAPTIVLSYASQSWQELALQVGQATGLEQQAEARIHAFDQYLAEARARLQRPAGRINIISYNGPGISNPIATPDGAHGRLLTALGFEVEAPDPAWHGGNGAALDFVWAQYEQLTRLTAETTFLTRVNTAQVTLFLNDPVLANLPSVQAGQVYGLGVNSFRIDYFSGLEIINNLLEQFAE